MRTILTLIALLAPLITACTGPVTPENLAGTQWQFSEVRLGPAYAALMDSFAPPNPTTDYDSDNFLATAARNRNQRELLEMKVKRFTMYGLRLEFSSATEATLRETDGLPDTLDFAPPTLSFRYSDERLARKASALHVRYATPDSLGLALTERGTADTLAYYLLLPTSDE